MNLEGVFKGIVADDKIVEQPEQQVSSVAQVNGSLALEDKFAYSESFSRTALTNDLNRNNTFIGDNYKNIKIDPNVQATEGINEINQDADRSDDPSVEEEQADRDSKAKLKTVYLTFDDGPNQYSEELLALLESYHAKATFFLIDKNIRSYPEAVNNMIESGHSVGLHSVSHSVKVFYQSASSVISEMDQVRNTVKDVSDIDTLLIRTPYGSVPHMQDSYMQAVHDNGYLMWDWNIDSKDWYYRDRRYVDTSIAQIQAYAGSAEPIVILLHERKETLAHLPALLEYLKEENYTMEAIDDTMSPVAFK
jgi:peptidoglycan/xylan/chitin deacetylase (PgdA/CDA1 family)